MQEKEKVTYLAFGVKTRVNYTIHIQVQVIKLNAIRVWLRYVDGPGRTPFILSGFFLHHIYDTQRVPIRQPPVKSGNPHPYRKL